MTWFLPTYKRPQRCQEALDSIAKGGPSKGIVVVDGDSDAAYAALRLPDGEGQDWRLVVLPENGGVCAALNWALRTYPDERWYGFFCDDQRVVTYGWEAPLVKAAGSTGFANSADGWQAGKRCTAPWCSAAICCERSAGGRRRARAIPAATTHGKCSAGRWATGLSCRR